MIAPIIFNAVALMVFAYFYSRDRKKGKEAFRLAVKSFRVIMPLIMIIFIFIIFFQEVSSADAIIRDMTYTSGPLGYMVAAFLGAIVHIPLFISFPIGGQLLQSGVNPGFIAVLITSLVMVHTFSIPIEVKELGFKFAFTRNALSLVFAVCIGMLMGVLY